MKERIHRGSNSPDIACLSAEGKLGGLQAWCGDEEGAGLSRGMVEIAEDHTGIAVVVMTTMPQENILGLDVPVDYRVAAPRSYGCVDAGPGGVAVVNVA